ncbi:MAG TPA: NADH-quinone oxidoreductase subunit L, partial [Sediminibacterium sp.]|nr:NADH-quinone oxidoreductase subunit L [Sediminibacterium sp.]
MHPFAYILLIPLLPLAGFALLGLFGRDYIRQSAGIIGSLLMAAAACLALWAAWQYFGKTGFAQGSWHPVTVCDVNWLRFTADIAIQMKVVLDPLTAMMLVVVSLVSLMVHIFSLGYMKGEDRYPAYFAFLSLFSFSMLGLVLAGNLFQIYIFWELVGVSSFLLIGFYYQKPSAVAASKKAFIITRFADFGFLIGILILAYAGKTLDIQELIIRLSQPTQVLAGFFGVSLAAWGLGLVFIGGAGKSAMFPLHVWLPDAMEGPTPVSALIHAATMVVAGVYLVARLFPLFSLQEGVMQLILYTGTFSALLAALIACTQTDIKRVLAYSTMSQIGYMMLSLGVARSGGDQGLGYMASLFHLFTHAFFKSLLFLAAGSVIHLVHSNEMGAMGGLRKYMPVTHIAFLTGCLAISGIPPFSGFFSKEEILHAAYQSDKLVYGIALFTAGLTAFYMFRLYFSVFWRQPPPQETHGHEGGWNLRFPLLFLSLLALGAGWIPFGKFISSDGYPLEPAVDWLMTLPPLVFALAGIALAANFYKVKTERPEKLAASLGGFYRIASRKFYIDEVYLFLTTRIIFPLVGQPIAWIDRNIVDGCMNAIARLTARIASLIKGMQSGRVQG